LTPRHTETMDTQLHVQDTQIPRTVFVQLTYRY